ncbi:MAG: 2-polyprenyl-3-methyl-6-methoxy-1,4-benzoquinone monooxygenase [Pseudomonadota bacterium]
MRRMNFLDKVLGGVDQALRTSAGVKPVAGRSYPAATEPHGELDEGERLEAIRLMRVNHAGEVAAQALYSGQAMGARAPEVTDALNEAAEEEIDHLAWCIERLDELGGDVSRLGPLWYLGSFAIGAAAGRAGDPWSLGFVAETEYQVGAHLQRHLARLPAQDHRSRAILTTMLDDELRHASNAESQGGRPLPLPVRQLMQLTSKFMTTGARWI